MSPRHALLVLPLLTLACGEKPDDTGGGDDSGGEAGVAVAGAARVEGACAPDDGAAYELVIGLDAAACDATIAGTWLRIALWADLEPMAGGTWDLDPAAGLAGVWYQADAAAAYEGVERGTLTVDTWDEVAGARGHYDLVTDSGLHLEGDFEALACLDDPPLCG